MKWLRSTPRHRNYRGKTLWPLPEGADAGVPDGQKLKRWATSEWSEYQAWLFHHALLMESDWIRMRRDAVSWTEPPGISIVTPVYNTKREHLAECVESIRVQAYPFWELLLYDDASDSKQTYQAATEWVAQDPRIRYERSAVRRGTACSTNSAIRMAAHDHIGFVDHDDRLSPDALYHVALTIRDSDPIDIIYSDMDMLSDRGLRYMHLFKPDWSPELLCSFNYPGHLMVYHRLVLERLRGLRPDFEGSQDYDLILRASEHDPKVVHIPKVLYHWRQHGTSISKAMDSKPHVWTAGVRVLQETLKRRGLDGEVTELRNLWRGNYQVRLRKERNKAVTRCVVRPSNTLADFAIQFPDKVCTAPGSDYLVFLSYGLRPTDDEAVTELVSWLQIPEVGIVTGKVVDGQHRFVHAGLVHRPHGVPLLTFAGWPESTAGYMACNALVRNVSSPFPYCFAIRRSTWDALGGLDREFCGPHTILDLSLRAQTQGFRTVYCPSARFSTQEPLSLERCPYQDRLRFLRKWRSWLARGDPYYNASLSLDVPDMGIELRVPGSER